MRIFSVTGTGTARTVASRMRAAAASSRISAEPALCPTATFFTGQPKLMSIRSAPRPSAIRAASAIAAGSHPASWIAFGPAPSTLAMRSVAWFSRTIAQDAIISDTTMPVPSRLASRRNGRSVTPDIGARMTGVSRVTARGPLPSVIDGRVGLPSIWAEYAGNSIAIAAAILACSPSSRATSASRSRAARCAIDASAAPRIPRAMRIAAILVAAGTGSRFGGTIPKQFTAVAGKPVIRHAAEALLPHVSTLLPVGDAEPIAAALDGLDVLPAVPGGDTRQASVSAGLQALAANAPDIVLVHDAARPFLPPTTIPALLAALRTHDGAIPASPSPTR